MKNPFEKYTVFFTIVIISYFILILSLFFASGKTFVNNLLLFVLILLGVFLFIQIKSYISSENKFELFIGYFIIVFTIIAIFSFLYLTSDIFFHKGYLQYGGCNSDFNYSLKYSNETIQTDEYLYFSSVTFFL